ncbi:DUF1062 domain-containing protein [Dongia deserti]|uniref:DUF1062 domain-containing protein n=1 Tax=Dongia deserti TaxID=2268030 RepID=UPI0013C4F501|nr:DUF1062 domain-containing protein [Dongia deserti]
MQQILRVTWQVAPLQCPLIRRHCSRCRTAMPFACSMKFRTNAQKKRIDVWLIYRCTACDETWNLPVHERVAVGDIPDAEFHAIACNDLALAMRHAFDHARLARHGILEHAAGVAVRKSPRDGSPRDASAIEIALAVSSPCKIRLDRLLASELRLTRSQLRALYDSGALRLSQAMKPLRTPVADGQSISIDLSDGVVGLGLAAMIRRNASE